MTEAKPSPNDEHFMRRALALAHEAAALGEVPIGAVVVQQGQVVGEGANRRELDLDPTAHAEILALRQAAQQVQSWRLDGATVYCTLEPCAMCAGAMVLARIERCVFATRDPKGGYLVTLGSLGDDPRLNHRFAHHEGVLQAESAALLKDFFGRLRKGGSTSGTSS